jgi:hypothetical protein
MLKKSIKENRILNNLNKKISFFIFILLFFRYIYLLKLNNINIFNLNSFSSNSILQENNCFSSYISSAKNNLNNVD